MGPSPDGLEAHERAEEEVGCWWKQFTPQYILLAKTAVRLAAPELPPCLTLGGHVKKDAAALRCLFLVSSQHRLTSWWINVMPSMLRARHSDGHAQHGALLVHSKHQEAESKFLAVSCNNTV